jgi:hypothetical protein
MPEHEWLVEANRLLGAQYGIDLNDVTDDGLPATFWFEESPQAFVDHVSEKYDLTQMPPWA